MNRSDVFRLQHLLAILEGFDKQTLPLDLHVMDYCRAHHALGSKDRKVIVDMVYSLIRWRALLDYLLKDKTSWKDRIELLSRINPLDYANQEDIPAHIRCSFPEELFALLAQDYGNEEAFRLGLICNTPAPTTVRANTLKTTRDALLEHLHLEYGVIPCIHSPLGITFVEKVNFRALDAFKQGLFEVQDEGSQLVAALVQATPGQTVLDFCAGSGGKALAIAAQMANRGQLFLHDVRKRALEEGRLRLRRAGVQNAQLLLTGTPHLSKLKKSCHWVLADVPCSGTGTLRRNPDMKWRFQTDWVARLRGEQRTIFERALSYMRPDGHIVYATCSLLKAENELQIDHFLKTYDLELVAQPFHSLPEKDGMDGFYGAVMRLRKN